MEAEAELFRWRKKEDWRGKAKKELLSIFRIEEVSRQSEATHPVPFSSIHP
jgi:hypothetical protein